MRRPIRFLLIAGCVIAMTLFLIGCEEEIDPGAGNGTIEFYIDPADINDSNHYLYMGNNITDSTFFRVESREGQLIKQNLGIFKSPLLNAGTWECDVYELEQAYSGDNAPDESIIVKRHLDIRVSLERDETELVTVKLQ